MADGLPAAGSVPADDRPLRGIVVVAALDACFRPITRYLADLGARVVTWDADSLAGLPGDAHVVVSSRHDAGDLAGLRADRPDLVTMRASPFGSNSPLAGWKATDPVIHALSSELSRSGIRGREPLLVPGDLAFTCGASQAAFALVAALYRALQTGQGAHFDFAALDGAVQALDPGFGVNGSATLGRAIGLLMRGRPKPGVQYPIFRCRDGHVRICLLSARQWRAMFAWLGEPAEFSDPEFDKTNVRFASRELNAAIAAFFAPQTRAQLELDGQRFGVPISAVNSFAEFAGSDHVRERQAVVRGADGAVRANGVLTIDGQRMGPGGEPAPGGRFALLGTAAEARLPFAGLRVLDLGVIVVGAEQARLFGDLGAEVLKVESRAFPDGNRQSYLKHGMSVSFAAGHRNKRSAGIDLRSPAGRALFLRLVAQADVVCSNFKPGTLDKLGLGAEVLRRANPAIVLSESSAFGDSGPWSGRMGYGPLVRAATGLTREWHYPGDPESFSDSITIYPDHVVGRICAIGSTALLIRRLLSQKGGIAHVAQAEVALDHFSSLLDAEASQQAPDHPWGVYPADGDDEWCVVTVTSDAEWQALCEVTGFAEGAGLATRDDRLAAKAAIDDHLAAWIAARDKEQAARELQAAGVPAAPMLRLAELLDHPHYVARGFFRRESHPWLVEEVRGERHIVPSDQFPPIPLGPAPLLGEHTEAAIAEWLGLGPDEVRALCEEGVLEPLDPRTRRQAEEHVAARATTAQEAGTHG
ncbi:CoA transferase [Novosphingobium bradum]|uniref:CoA transferase n=1 Tax=Novosphingobium bradum TaxID=1737444 RepID=A0ABV7IPZ7_9SPHN